jgi:transketolase
VRNDFVRQMLEEMEKNREIVFLTADLGFNALEPIKNRFSKRFYNVGIAEANMVGMACGLAHEGKKVICYSIAPFVSLRAYEQIRLDVCYDNLDIKIVGAGGGFNYAAHGVTHHTIEDIAALSALPNMRVANPAYSFEAREVTKAMMQTEGPCYVRLGKNPVETFSSPASLKLGEAYPVKEGNEMVLLSTGNLLERSCAVAEALEEVLKIRVGVISVPWIKPLDIAYIKSRLDQAFAVFTIEEHNIIGGLGSLVAKLIAEEIPGKIFEAYGIQDKFHKEVGSRDYLLDVAGLSVKVLVQRMKKKWESRFENSIEKNLA